MYFKAKDYVTAGNAVSGLASVVCVIEGELYWAALFICASWIFDTLDGVVARLTNTFNKFGGEFDTMCDHLTYGIAPGFFVYGVYREWLGPYGEWAAILGGAALGFWLPITASIRSARLTVKPIKVPGFWIGLPRPVSAFVTVSWFNTSTIALYPEVGHWLGIVLVFALGASNLGAFPFLSHHNAVYKWWVRPLLWATTVVLVSTGLLGPLPELFGMEILPRETFFDAFFFLLFGYATVGWFGIPTEHWRRVRTAVAEWKALPDP